MCFKGTQPAKPAPSSRREASIGRREQRFGFRPLHGNDRQLRALRQFTVQAAQLAAHPRQVLLAGNAIDHEPIAALHPVHDEVIDDAPVMIEHGRVEGTAFGLQPFDIVREQGTQEIPCTGLGNIHDRHVRHVEHARRFAHSPVFGNLRAVVHRHVPAVEIDDTRPGRFMSRKEGGTLVHGVAHPRCCGNCHFEFEDRGIRAPG